MKPGHCGVLYVGGTVVSYGRSRDVVEFDWK